MSDEEKAKAAADEMLARVAEDADENAARHLAAAAAWQAVAAVARSMKWPEPKEPT